jgi:hypothetical protein
VRSAWATAANCDTLLLIIDAYRQVGQLMTLKASVEVVIVADDIAAEVVQRVPVECPIPHPRLTKLEGVSWSMCACACARASSSHAVCACFWQIMQPDPRVVKLVQELAEGPLPDWESPPALLILNKVHACSRFLWPQQKRRSRCI